MRFSALLAFIGASVVIASPVTISGAANSTVTPRRCGTTISPEKLIAAEKHFEANKPAQALVESAAAATIPVYMHVISEDTTAAGGNLPFVRSFICSECTLLSRLPHYQGFRYCRSDQCTQFWLCWLRSLVLTRRHHPHGECRLVQQRRRHVGPARPDEVCPSRGWRLYPQSLQCRVSTGQAGGLCARLICCWAGSLARGFLVMLRSRPTIRSTQWTMVLYSCSLLSPVAQPRTTIKAR